MGKISIVTNTKEDIFNFPCDYPIKVFGLNHPDFEKTVCNIVETHTGKLHGNQTTIKYWFAITIKFSNYYASTIITTNVIIY